MKSLLDPESQSRLWSRFQQLRPDAPARWGQLTAPLMVTHLIDQMRYTLGEYSVTLLRGPLRVPPLKQAMMYWLPWPKGRVKGSPEMFLTRPGAWDTDLATLGSLLDRFIRDPARDAWPEHPAFGRMTHQSWGRFTHRHFDWHLRQFGV